MRYGFKATADDVGKFLESISLAEHAKLFVEDGVDGETLLALNDKNLEEQGVKEAQDYGEN